MIYEEEDTRESFYSTIKENNAEIQTESVENAAEMVHLSMFLVSVFFKIVPIPFWNPLLFMLKLISPSICVVKLGHHWFS